jgi:translocation and assembly module TamA
MNFSVVAFAKARNFPVCSFAEANKSVAFGPHCRLAGLALLWLMPCLALALDAVPTQPAPTQPVPAAGAEATAAPDAAAPKRPNRVFTKILGIEDKAMRLNALRAIELRALKRKEAATEAQIRRLFRRAPKQIATSLEPYGYYQAGVKSSLALQGDKYLANFTVDVGPRTVLEAVNFKLDGPAELDERVNRAWRKIALKVGEPLDHTRYEAAKSEVQRALLQRGYLDAELTEHRIDVTRADAKAQVFLTWSTGVRYAMGKTTFSGGQFSPEFLSRYVAYEENDLYTQARLLNLQQRLVDADYFSVVEIAPETEEAANGIVPISVLLVPAKRSIYTYGVSVGTDSGAGVKGGLERRWVNSAGHKFRSGAEASQRLKALAVSYEIPLPDKARTSYAVNVSYRDEETDTSRAKLTKLGLARSREWKGWQQTYALQWLRGNFTVGGEQGQSTLLYPELILYKRDADDLLYPRQGYALTVNARAGAKGLLSDTSFANASIEGRYIRALGENSRFLAHGAFGALYAQRFDDLPPELRFFTGGDRSVRGYRYQTLGPLNAGGKVRGGKYLAVVSGEYEYSFSDTWGAATFIDLGNAFDASGNQLKKSVGAGMRWRSPVGVVRLDLAYAIDEQRLRPHLVIGPDL